MLILPGKMKYKPINVLTKFKVMKTIYFNMKTSYGTETVDELSKEDFETWKDFYREVRRLVLEYHICGMNVYTSKRCTKDWKN